MTEVAHGKITTFQQEDGAYLFRGHFWNKNKQYSSQTFINQSEAEVWLKVQHGKDNS